MLITLTTNASRCGSNFNNLGCSAERKTMSMGFYVCGVSFEVSSNENGPLQIKECSEYNKQAHTQEARATIRVVCVLQLII